MKELDDKKIRDALYNFVMTTSDNPADYPDIQLFEIMMNLVRKGGEALQLPLEKYTPHDYTQDDE